ncbi:MAG: hypothetical protein U0232_03285 [Thermomicrobiales bacterium]
MPSRTGHAITAKRARTARYRSAEDRSPELAERLHLAARRGMSRWYSAGARYCTPAPVLDKLLGISR